MQTYYVEGHAEQAFAVEEEPPDYQRLVGNSAGDVNLAALLAGHLADETPGGLCVEASLRYFANSCATLGVRTVVVPGLAARVPLISTSTGTPIAPKAFWALWTSASGRTDDGSVDPAAANYWQSLPAHYRGAGGAGALLYADLADDALLSSATGWPDGLQPGAVLQMWSTRAYYDELQADGTPAPQLGHSCVFRRYESADQIVVADQISLEHSIMYGWLGLRFVLAANPGRASVAGTAAALTGPPGEVAATRVDGGASVSWAEPIETNGLPVTGYVVEGSANGQAVVTLDLGSPEQTAIAKYNSGPDVWPEVSFRVCARTAAGEGQWSMSAIAFNKVPSPPQNLKVECVADPMIMRVSFDKPAQTYGLTVRHYEVQTRNGGDWQYDGVIDGSLTTGDYLVGAFSFPEYQVAAVTDAGRSDYCSPARNSIPAPSPPAELTATRMDLGAALTWNPPADCHGLPVLRYILEQSIDGSPFEELTVSIVETTYMTWYGLGQLGEFRVSAETSAGRSTPSASAVATNLTPSAPTITATRAYPNAFKINISIGPPGSTYGLTVRYYQLYYDGEFNKYIDASGSGICLLSPSEHGTFTCTAVTDAGEGQASAPSDPV